MIKKITQFLFVTFFFAQLFSVELIAQTVTYNYTGGQQTYTVPTGVTSLTIDARGAAGGNGTSGNGGLGGRVQTTLSVTPGQTLYIYVGGAGGNLNTGTPGYNGGGSGSGAYCCNIGGGGGASDIRIGGTALSNRVVVAGGGGGGAYNGCGNEQGGSGGGLTGVAGGVGCGIQAGQGGTQSAGGAGGAYSGWTSGTAGSLGQGGNGGASTGGGGGGGGYYGGGGGSWNGGGGGSSYSSGTGTIHTQGFQSGNGQILITPACAQACCYSPVAVETDPQFTAASGCSNGTFKTGSGAYYDLTVAANTYYNFTWTNGTNNTGGFCAIPQNGNAVAFNSNQTAWFSGTTTSLRVSNVRIINNAWQLGITSAIMTYRHTEPNAVTVSAPGVYCGSTTLTASGGGNGTIYWQNTTSNGTSTTTPSTSQTVSSNGTYYFRSGNNGCFGTQGSAAVTIKTPSSAPTSITGSTTICSGGSTTLSTSGGTLGSDAVHVWYRGGCGDDAFDQNWNTQPYSTANTTLNSNSNGLINVSSTTNDPMINMYNLGSFNPNIYKFINVRYRVISGSPGNMEFFFTNSLYGSANAAQQVNSSGLITGGAWQVMSIDMSAHPNWTNSNITGWRFDWCTGNGVNMEIDFISLSQYPIIGEGSSISVSPTSNTIYSTRIKGYCNNTTCASTTVTVNPINTISLTSANNTQTRCSGAAIANITYNTTGATGVSVTGLPSGVTASWASNVITISGTPNVPAGGTFNFTVNMTGGCTTGQAAPTGTITVSPTNTISLTSANNTQTVCSGVAIANITYNTTGATGVSVTGLPSGVTASWASNVITISGTPNVPAGGTFNFTVNMTGGCTTGQAAPTGTIVVDGLSNGGTATSNQTICTGGTPANLSVTGINGNVIKWQFANDAAFTSGVTDIPSSNSTTLTSAQMGALTANRYYRAIVVNGVCSQAAATVVTITVNPQPIAPTILPSIASGTTVCLNQTISATFSGGSGGAGVSTNVYEYSTDGGTNWNAYTPGDLIPTPTVGTNIIQIRTRREANGLGCSNSAYNSASWSVANQPSLPSLASSIPANPNAGICQGDVVSATITPGSGGGSGATDEYEYSIDNGATWNAYTSGNNINTNTATGSVQVRVRRQSDPALGCNSTIWSVVTNWPVSVPTVGGTLAGGNSPLCFGGPLGALNLTGATGNVQKWEYDVNGSGNWQDIANNTTTYNGGTPAVGTIRFRVEVKSGVCPADYSNTVSISVAAQPSITISPENNINNNYTDQGCTGDIFKLNSNVTGGVGTPQYQWYQYNYGTNTYSSITGATGVFYNTAPLINNSGTNDNLYKFKVEYSVNGLGCNATLSEVEITIFPTPSLTSTIEDCAAGAMGNGNADYVYLIASNGVAPYQSIVDLTDNTNTPVFNANNTVQIYKVGINSGQHDFEVTDANGCKVVSTLNPSTVFPTTLPLLGNASGNLNSTCRLLEFNEWVHFRNANDKNEIIASINDNGLNLGIVNVTSYKESASVEIDPVTKACPQEKQAAMRRHFKITSNQYNSGDQFGNGNTVGVRLYFTQSDFADLSAASLANDYSPSPVTNCTGNDNIGMSELMNIKLTKYSGDFENGDYADNDFTNGIFRVFGTGTQNPMLVVPSNAANDFNTLFQTNSGDPIHYVELEVSEFSEFWLHGGNGGTPLPVEMLFIEAKNINNSYIQINWATATELNNWKFEVERSTDGVNFTKIGEVIGNGTSTDRHDYTYNDKNVVPGIRYYYRLKQIDFDESYEYSPVVSEMLRGDDLFKVSDFVPNPAADQAKLIITTGKEQEVQIEMHNYLGEIVKKGTTYLNKGSNTINFDFGDLAAGTYTTRVVAGTNTHVRRVVITR